MEAIYKKDLKSAFQGMTGWVLCAFVTFILGLYFTALCLGGGYTEISVVFNNVMFIFLVVVPILTMRSIVEERRQKTDQLLLTSPASIGSIVLGKYFALLTIYAIPLLFSCLMPPIMSMFGTVSFPRAYAAIFAFFLLGAAAIAIGLFISSLTESQIIAAVCTFGTLLLLYLMTSIASLISTTASSSLICFTLLFAAIACIIYVMMNNFIMPIIMFAVAEITLFAVYYFNASALEGAFPSLLNSIALFDRYAPFVNGVIDVSALVYFVSVALLFVFLTCQSLEKRRWS